MHQLSTLAQGLIGSEVLKIAGEIRVLESQGRRICNMTVGDFSPAQFRIPSELQASIVDALAAGETNYPPSDGTMDLRKAVVALYEKAFGLTYPVEAVLIAGGSRPIIYATYAAIVDPGDRVVYPTPSWNNNHYTYLSRGEAVEVVVGPETNFLPTAELLRPHVKTARLIALNTPLNPTGTVMEEDEVRAIAQLVVDENRRRATSGERPLYLMWDAVYWMLTFGGRKHWNPPQLVPESKEWTIIVDGISKAFAATGVRVGWVVAPPAVTSRMRDILGHIGAWAPRAEQTATARYFADGDIEGYHREMIAALQKRLDLLHDGFEAMRADGLPVRAFSPQGAIYLSVQFDLIGRTGGGRVIRTNEEIRQLLLEEAGFAVVPFQAFGLRSDTGWMRLSVGAVSTDDIAAGLERVRKLLTSIE